MSKRRHALFTLMLLASCRAGPTRREAADALRATWTAADSTAVVRVWADGPPWFSCAEVVAKLQSASDHAVVRDALRPWRSLVTSDWVRLRDTSAGPVVEPGWCVARLHDSSSRTGWTEIEGEHLPSGGSRRGWDVQAGTRHIDVAGRPQRLGSDSARVSYVITIVPNENGRAMGADRDTTRAVAVLVKENGAWRVGSGTR
ncbi:MAG: hypothetical protein JWM95_1982 [Gemmatimonadetes bacterium]|nr:hypothetical protein [Gemmatimonadota bacterium]